MKKALSLSLALILCLSMLFSVVSCGTHPIKAFYDKMKEENNYELTMKFSNVPIVNNIKLDISVDENIMYVDKSLINNAYYIETVDDDTYVYTKPNMGYWTKTKAQLTNTEYLDAVSDESLDVLFDFRNYERVDYEANTYRLRIDVIVDGFDDVIVVVDENSCAFEMEYEELGCDLKIIISKVGEVELTLPI